MQYVLARLSKTTLHRILQESEPLAFDADTEAESEAESEGDALHKVSDVSAKHASLACAGPMELLMQ